MKKEEISLKNTKAEILDALNEALQREKNMANMKYEPEKEEKKSREEKAVKSAKESVEQKIFSEELNNKFKDLEMAIVAEEEKLKELYGVEKELNNLVVVVNAGKDYMTELENKKKIKTDELNDQIKSLEEEYKNKKEELEKDYDIKARNLKLERDREVEEYNYKTKRDRELANNKWEDEKSKREAILASKEEETSKLLEDAKASAKNVVDLENKVNEIPALLEKEYARGRKEATAELEKEHKYEMELLKKDYQSTIDRQNDRIETYKLEIEKSNEEKKSLQEKLDQSYLQIKEMATKTVEATGGVKIIGNNNEQRSS